MEHFLRLVMLSAVVIGGLSACATLEETYKTNLGIARGPITLNCAMSFETVESPGRSEVVFGTVSDRQDRPVTVERDGEACRRQAGCTGIHLNYQFDSRIKSTDIVAQDARRVLSATGFTLLPESESLPIHKRLDLSLATVYVDHSYSFTSRIEATARFTFLLRITRIEDERTLWSTKVTGEDSSESQGILSDATVEAVLNGAYCDALKEFRALVDSESFRGYLSRGREDSGKQLGTKP